MIRRIRVRCWVICRPTKRCTDKSGGQATKKAAGENGPEKSKVTTSRSSGMEGCLTRRGGCRLNYIKYPKVYKNRADVPWSNSSKPGCGRSGVNYMPCAWQTRGPFFNFLNESLGGHGISASEDSFALGCGGQTAAIGSRQTVAPSCFWGGISEK